MKKRTTEQEIQDVMAEEKNRGKRKIDREAQILNRQFKEDFFQLVREGDVKRFKSFLNAHGLQEGSEKYQKVMELWQISQKQKKR